MQSMSAAPVYSERLGAISDSQLAAAVARLDLGLFVSAEPVTGGLFGQNLFLTTTAGAFVLRGAPHWVNGRRDDRVQFAQESFFIRRVHEQTGAPAPWPCHYDASSDIFGWPYLVMPRMPGACFDLRTIRRALPQPARREVATSMGETIARLQRLSAPAAGAFDVDLGAIAPDREGYAGFLISGLSTGAVGAEAAGIMTAADMDWIGEVCRSAGVAPSRPATFVHGDFKLDNVTVAERDGAWRVTGLFDFHTARFGDSAYDLARPTLFYLDSEPALAPVIVDAWRGAGGDDAHLAASLPLYVAHERVSLWAGFVKPDARPAWSAGETFRSWSERHLERLLALIA